MQSRSEQTSIARRVVYASSIMCLAFSLLIVRLWYLQCVYGSYFRDLSENNRTRTVRTVPPRGIVYDSEDRVLVRNRPAFDIALMLEDTPNVTESIKKLAEITGRDAALLERQFLSRARGRHFEPRVVIADVTREELARVKVNTYRLPGVIINAVPARAYPHGSVAAQLLGYAREISKTQLDNLGRKEGYFTGDLIGQSGIEKQWENYLRGRSGYVEVEVDAHGNRRGELGIVDDQAGNDIHLTIDVDLQSAAEQGLQGRRGAVVVLNPQNGAVLALASGPSFDANIFSGKMDAQNWEQVSGDKNKPLTNRAISSKYPPGSTFKLFMAVAGLASGKINVNTEFNCPGYYMLGGHPYKCHKHSGHGVVNLQKAITVSCNAYFYTLGQLLQINNISYYSEMFGFGRVTGIELPGEDPGISPSVEWKEQVYGERWYPGDTIPVSIGQGYLNVTPLQMAVATSAIANGGKVYQPQIIRKVVNSQTGEVKEFMPKLLRELPVQPETIKIIQEHAIYVVNDPHGTGKRAQLPGITVAGKTGTAQTGALGKESLGEQFKDHAWFISFAPAENPSIAMAIIVENTGHGGEFAAPISKQVMEVYFRKLGMLTEPEPENPSVKDSTPKAVVTTEVESRDN